MRGWTSKVFSLFLLGIICLVTVISPLSFPSIVPVSAKPNVPYSLGNWSTITKPVLPVKIYQNQILVGFDWTYVYPLEAGAAYRVYCYGDWIDYSADISKTDYDIFVYGPTGQLESYHTEAAGLPEHLGTTVDHPFFIPAETGDYSFRIRNDARESDGAEAATFMIIEHVESGKWYERQMQGKIKDQPVEKTTWAYEFNSSSSRIEVFVDVPDTLDMYEARLYVMSNPLEEENATLNGVPLAWEPALHGEYDQNYGGYNLDSDGLRYTEALASCEYPGQDMLITFDAPTEGNLLYHLALIAENGVGTIKFRVKTEFDAPNLTLTNPPEQVSPNTRTTINAVVDDQFVLENVSLSYSSNNWANTTSVEMTASADNLYNASIPGQKAGTTVDYTVLASDTSGNTAQIGGSYEVKNTANINLQLSNTFIYCGDALTVTGSLPVSETNVQLNYAVVPLNTNLSKLNYTSENASIRNLVTADSTGKFTDVPALTKSGTWVVWATWNGTATYFAESSPYQKFTYNKLNKIISCNLTKTIAIGDNITVTGEVYPPEANLSVLVTFVSANGTSKRTGHTNINGTYTIQYKPDMMGLWQVTVQLVETATIAPSYSNSTTFTVTDTFLNQYLLFIVGGAGGGGGIGAFVFIKKRREE